MSGFVEWLKKEDVRYGRRYMVILKAVLITVLPLFCCLVYCGAQGRGLFDVSLPDSPWNDELFYFKQVEGIVKYGYPKGYFGFNESHALKLSFAAWSPVLVLPWILWGVCFGWNLMSPIICNIVLLSAAALGFMLLVKPTWKQTGLLAFLFCLYTPFVRYMLSGMPEIICFSLVILFYGIGIHYLENEKKGELFLLFGLAALLTLMRPYMLLFLLLPGFFCVRKYRGKGVVFSVAVAVAALAGYAGIKHFFGAEYFTPLFYTDAVTTFFESGILAGIRHLFGKLYWMGSDFFRYMYQGAKTGLAAGAFFGAFMVMMLVLIGQGLHDFRRKKNKFYLIEMHLAFCFVGMLFALLLMYKLTEGSKHLLTFMAAGVFVVSLMETKTYKKAVFVGAVFAYLFLYRGTEPYDYQVPFAQEETVAQQERWREIFREGMELSGKGGVPNYDNVVIWTLNDEKDGEKKNTKWQVLYALPPGMGISCCEKDYLEEHFRELQSRYLMTLSGGGLDEMCRAAGYEELGRDGDVAVYRLYRTLP